METVIKPNDIIDQILTIAAELTPAADKHGYGEPWAKMLATRDRKDAHTCAYALANSVYNSWEPCAVLMRVAHAITNALHPGHSCLQLHYDLQEVQDARAFLEPLLAELRKVPA